MPHVPTFMAVLTVCVCQVSLGMEFHALVSLNHYLYCCCCLNLMNVSLDNSSCEDLVLSQNPSFECGCSLGYYIDVFKFGECEGIFTVIMYYG